MPSAYRKTNNNLPTTSVFFGVKTTAQNIASGASTMLTWVKKFSSDHLKQGSGSSLIIVDVNGAGWYKVRCRTTWAPNTTTAGYITLQLYKNAAAVADCLSRAYAAAVTTAYVNCNLDYVLYLNKGESVGVMATATSVQMNAQANYCSLLVEGITNQGWNNGEGGITRYDRLVQP